MAETKKYSLEYFAKRKLVSSNPMQEILDTVRTYQETDRNHPELDFSGTPFELAHALYYEVYKKGVVITSLFPTPPEVAREMARLLTPRRGDVVFDPGAGFGNLCEAVQYVNPEATVYGVEFNYEAVQLAQLLGWDVQQFDFLEPDLTDRWLKPFDKAIVNPPFGNLFNHSNIEVDFMLRIAELAPPGAEVVALLPTMFWRKNTNKFKEVYRRYEVQSEYHLETDAFKPLTKINAALYLLTVQAVEPPEPKRQTGARKTWRGHTLAEVARAVIEHAPASQEPDVAAQEEIAHRFGASPEQATDVYTLIRGPWAVEDWTQVPGKAVWIPGPQLKERDAQPNDDGNGVATAAPDGSDRGGRGRAAQRGAADPESGGGPAHPDARRENRGPSPDSAGNRNAEPGGPADLPPYPAAVESDPDRVPGVRRNAVPTPAAVDPASAAVGVRPAERATVPVANAPAEKAALGFSSCPTQTCTHPLEHHAKTSDGRYRCLGWNGEVACECGALAEGVSGKRRKRGRAQPAADAA